MLEPIDLSTFEEVPAPQARAEVLRLSLSGSGKLFQNKAFHKRLGSHRDFHLMLSPDGRRLVLLEDENRNLSFTPKGVRTHHSFLKMLEKKGLTPPLSYRVEWDDSVNGWLGSYDGLCAPVRKAGKKG